MKLIDDFAYNNHLRSVDPAYKAALTLSVLLLCLVLDSPLVGIVALLWMVGLAVFMAGLPLKVFGRVLLAEFSFFVLATAGVAVSVSLTSPLSINPWAVQAGPFWLSTSREALDQALLILTRVMGCVAAMNFLALTTPMVDLIALFSRLRIPNILIDITTLMYRFIFALLESLHTMWIAQESRLGYSSGFWRSIVSAGHLGSRLFIDAFQRSKRLQTALDSRAYQGELRVLTLEYETGGKITIAGILLAFSLLLTWILT